MWQTDFTYLKIIGWGWMYLSTDPRRLLALHHRLEAVHHDEGRATSPIRCRHRAGRLGLRSGPTSATSPGCSAITAPATYRRRPRGPGSTTGAHEPMSAVAPRTTPRPRGKIERWHQTLKNRILLENYFLPGDLECQLEAFVEHYKSPALPREPEQCDACRRLISSTASMPPPCCDAFERGRPVPRLHHRRRAKGTCVGQRSSQPFRRGANDR